MPTKIEWCDYTINPVVGCSKISEGCQNCYAETMAWRLKCMGIPKYQDVVDENGWTGQVGVDMSVFDGLPKKPKKIFISSMGDLFHSAVPDDVRVEIFKKISQLENHIFMILTKRPNRMLTFFATEHSKFNMAGNCWFGVTVESPEYLHRISVLLKFRATVLFVSIEPMLQYMDIYEYLYWLPCLDGRDRSLLNWVIAGPETGPGKRECKPEWIEDLFQQCSEAGVPFFDKRKSNYLTREFPK